MPCLRTPTVNHPHSPSARPLIQWVLWLVCLAPGLGACSSEVPKRRVLIVGWDGATFDLIDPLIKEGRMPVLADLMQRGQHAWLESSRVPISSAAWVGACSGHHPGETGVYDFFQRVEGSYEVEVIDARSNLCPPIWRILTGRGATVNVLGVPITWPPEPVRGHLAAGMLSPPAEDWAWPPEYTSELRERGLLPDVGIWTQMRSLAPDQMLERVHEQLLIKEQVTLDLLGRNDWDLSMVVFKSLDVISHQRYDGNTQGVIADLLEDLDRILGNLIKESGPQTDVIVMSDHGFGVFPFTFNLYPWLVNAGLAVEQGEGPPTQPAAAPLIVFEAETERLRLKRLDLAQTRVLATNTECEGNYGSLRLNLAGREPGGVVPADQAEALLTEVEAALRAIEVPGGPLVTDVWRGAQLYPGPANDCVPDLIFETRTDWQVVASAVGPALTQHQVPRPNHRLDGIFAAAGSRISSRADRARWSVFDLAPTALHLMGHSIYEEMSGEAHAELLSSPQPVRRIARADDPTYRPSAEAWKELTQEQRQAQIDQLKALGYADDSDD